MSIKAFSLAVLACFSAFSLYAHQEEYDYEVGEDYPSNHYYYENHGCRRSNAQQYGSDNQRWIDQRNSNPNDVVAFKVRRLLSNDSSLSPQAKDVEIIVNNDVVVLNGNVENANEKARVEAIAKQVAEVKSVTNNLNTINR